MKKLLILFLLLLLGGGGGYYYFSVYQPAAYAKSVLALDDWMRAPERNFVPPTLRGNYDYEGARKTLQQRDTVFTELETKIAALNPPIFSGDMKRLHEDAVALFAGYREAIVEAEQRIAFAQDAAPLLLMLQPDSSTARDFFAQSGKNPPEPLFPATVDDTTVGNFLDVFAPALPNVKAAGTTLFSRGDAPDIGDDPSFSELQTLWEQTIRGFDAGVAYLRTLDRATSMRSLPPPAELARQDPELANFEKIDEFIHELENAIIHNNADHIIQAAAAARELDERETRFYEALQELRRTYAQQP